MHKVSFKNKFANLKSVIECCLYGYTAKHCRKIHAIYEFTCFKNLNVKNNTVTYVLYKIIKNIFKYCSSRMMEP